MQSQFGSLLAEIRHNEYLAEAARLHIVDQVCAHRAAPGVIGASGWRRRSVTLPATAARLHARLQRFLTTTSGKGSTAVLTLGVDVLSIER
jgi:hypothetical protein